MRLLYLQDPAAVHRWPAAVRQRAWGGRLQGGYGFGVARWCREIVIQGMQLGPSSG